MFLKNPGMKLLLDISDCMWYHFEEHFNELLTILEIIDRTCWYRLLRTSIYLSWICRHTVIHGFILWLDLAVPIIQTRRHINFPLFIFNCKLRFVQNLSSLNKLVLNLPAKLLTMSNFLEISFHFGNAFWNCSSIL